MDYYGYCQIAYSKFPGASTRMPARSHFLGKGGIFGRSLGKISRENQEKGVLFGNCQR